MFINTSPAKKTALFDISLISPNRRLFQIASQFLYSGYDCYIHLPFKRFMKMDFLGRKIALTKNVYPSRRSKKALYSAVISDNKDILNSYDSPIKIFFNLYIFENLNKVTQNDFFYPILIFPDFLNHETEKTIFDQSFNNDRKILALFIGKIDDDYNNQMTKDLFNINTRQEIFSFIKDNFPDDKMYIPQNINDLLEKTDSGELARKIVLLNTANFALPGQLWFKILLNTQFFIHMCGYIQPFCHNQIESMLSGCIPITQFSRFFIPQFKHEENALTFNTLEELYLILVNILEKYYNSNINFLRKNINLYYQANYSFESFSNKLNQLLNENISQTNYYIACGEENILKRLIKND
jgi:hypothetical protein